MKDFVIAYGSNKTMMDNAFNPFLREMMPPVLVQVTAQSGVEWGSSWGLPCVRRAWTDVYVEAVDTARGTLSNQGVRILNRPPPFACRGAPEEGPRAEDRRRTD